MEEEKFYQKNWFMWATLVLFAPVGIFLMWKYDRFSKNVKIALSVIFGLFFIIAISGNNTSTNTTANKPAQSKTTKTVKAVENPVQQKPAQQKLKLEQERKNQQDKFLAWYKDYESQNNLFNENYDAFKSVINDMSNGSMDRNTVNDKLNKINSSLEELQQWFNNNSVPKELSEKHQKLLHESNIKMSVAAEMIRDAITSSLNYLNTLDTNELEKVKGSIENNDFASTKSLSNIVQVRKDLGLVK